MLKHQLWYAVVAILRSGPANRRHSSPPGVSAGQIGLGADDEKHSVVVRMTASQEPPGLESIMHLAWRQNKWPIQTVARSDAATESEQDAMGQAQADP